MSERNKRVRFLTKQRVRKYRTKHFPIHLFFSFFFSASFWGKYGERQNKPQTHVIQAAHQLQSLLNDPSFHSGAFRICLEEVMEVVTTRVKEEVEKSLKTTLFTAIFTTAHARLKLKEKEFSVMTLIRLFINGAQGKQNPPTRFVGRVYG